MPDESATDALRIFHPNRIKIPENLAVVLKEYAKAVIRAQPSSEDIYKFSMDYFKEKVAENGEKPGAEEKA